MATENDYKYWFISTAEGEIGYLEKASMYDLYNYNWTDGNGNYTRYWAEIDPNSQGQPWCACFVTWCLMQVIEYNLDVAYSMLRHYPYVYCPTLAEKFNSELHNDPRKGDIVIFYRDGAYRHTGIVSNVDNYGYETIEGNTSPSGYSSEGGGVYRKYYWYGNEVANFVTLDWSIAGAEHTWMGAYAKVYLDILNIKGIISNTSYWSQYDDPVYIKDCLALIDKLTGGISTFGYYSYKDHWAKKHLDSLNMKGIIKNVDTWINRMDSAISRALLLALVDNASGGIMLQYVNQLGDHWARRHLNSLCDKRAISGTSGVIYWQRFEDQVSRANCMALICKGLNVNI